MTMPNSVTDQQSANTLEVQRLVIVDLVRQLGGSVVVPAVAMIDAGQKLEVERNGRGELLLTVQEPPEHVHELHIEEDSTVTCARCPVVWTQEEKP